MSFSNTSTTKGKGKGKWSERKKKKRRQQHHHHHHQEPRTTETASHILAALEAQRARASQQSLPTPSQQTSAPATTPATTTTAEPPPPPPPPPLPGYVFDPTRNRFFRMVKDSLGTPGNAKASNHASVRRQITIPIVGGQHHGSRPPQRKGGKIGRSGGVQGSKNNGSSGNGSMDSVVSSAAALVGGPAVVDPFAGSVAPGARCLSRPTGRRGLHSYAMNSRRGLWGFGSRAPGSRGGAVGVIPGGPERIHRAGLESIVSSSRFRLRSVAPWAHTAPGAAYSSIDLDADRNLLAVGTISGALGVMTTGLESASVGGGGGDRPGRGFAQWRSGARQQEERVCWANAASWASGQVSDIKFRANGNEWACATASLGSAGEPGGVNARFWREGGQEGARDVVNFFSGARVCEGKLRRGSVWCTEWDPLTPSRLAVGPSTSSPVSFFDVEKQRLTPVAKLAGDVFSVSFLPIAAPGAGHAFVCGLRDGSVVLVDPRQPPRQNLTITVARNLTSAGRGGGGGGSRSRQHARFSGTNRSGGGCSADTELLVRLDCSSVDHTHILRDGTRCLVKDRSGGLQSVDLRVFACGGNGSDAGRGQGRARPLKALVPPGARAATPGRFAVDPTEAVVVTPVPVAAAAARAAPRGGSSSGPVVTGGAWDAFSSSGTAGHPFPGTTSDVNSGGVGNNGGGGGDGSTPFAVRDRLRFLNVSSGDELNDIQTPWTGVSLATERGAAAAAFGPGTTGSGHGVRFWGTAWEPGQGATVFEARLRSEPSGGYGRP